MIRLYGHLLNVGAFLSPAVWVGFRSGSEKSVGSLPLTFLKFPFVCQVGLEPGFL